VTEERFAVDVQISLFAYFMDGIQQSQLTAEFFFIDSVNCNPPKQTRSSALSNLRLLLFSAEAYELDEPDRIIISASTDCSVKLWSLETGKKPFSLILEVCLHAVEYTPI
jgi:WD40 repeat protein